MKNELLPSRKIKAPYGLINIVETNKFKNLNIYFSFKCFYSEKRKASLMVLLEILKDVSKVYPNKKEMLKAKNLLYGAYIDSDISYIDDKIDFSIHYNFLDPYFIKDITIDDYLTFINNTLLSALINEELLNEKVKILKDIILRKLESPNTYATNRINEIMAKDDKRFKALISDNLAELDKLCLKDLEDTYREIFCDYETEVYVIGKENKVLINKLKKLPFSFNKLENKPYKKCRLINKGEIIEHKKISQASLFVVYKSPYHHVYNEDYYFAWMVGMAFLGILPTSLLFNEVREKKSLCYSIYIRDDKDDGLMKVITNISKEHKDEVVKEIAIQLERLVKMDYEPEMFEISKTLLIDSLKSSLDEASSIYLYKRSSSLRNTNLKYEDLLKGISKVTQEDVSKIFRGFKHYLTYELRDED